MASVKRYEDLDSYKLAVEVRREVLRLTRRERVRRDFKFVSQIRNAARGGPRNIVEGFSRFSPAEILHFLSYAKSSLDETKSHVADGQESDYFSDEEAQRLLVLIRRTQGAISGWMRYLESPAARRFYEQHRARRMRPEPKPGTDRTRAPEPKEPQNPRTREPENPENPEK